jgi:hypothetical protein
VARFTNEPGAVSDGVLLDNAACRGQCQHSHGCGEQRNAQDGDAVAAETQTRRVAHTGFIGMLVAVMKSPGKAGDVALSGPLWGRSGAVSQTPLWAS